MTLTLREYIDMQWDNHAEKHRDAIKLLDQIQSATEVRLEKLNELRTEVIEDRSQFLRREVYDADVRTREKRIAVLENWQSKAAGIGLVATLIAGAIGALIVRVFGG